ncbi:hypothetical protein ACFYZ4_28845 [Streptomyces sp. NPDC001513]|uniref:hypothetical protein n=1 Tax=Streptomyces sp. NPDC001513 TaxID=3364580 RepID=UPI0036A03757
MVVFFGGASFAVVGTVVAWSAFGGRASFDAGTTLGQAVAVGVYQGLVSVLTVGVAFAARHPAGARCRSWSRCCGRCRACSWGSAATRSRP